MISHRIKHGWLINCFITFLTLVVTIAANCRKPPGFWEAGIFRRYVLKPIPQSVADIKVDKLATGGIFPSGHRYVLRFKISKSDVALIINSRAFEESEWVGYKHGTHWDTLEWGDSNSLLPRQSVIVYMERQHPPAWFEPKNWNSPKVYSFREKWGRSRRYRTQVLIFNEDLAEAYFFEVVPGR
jgi:hypothetical protein